MFHVKHQPDKEGVNAMTDSDSITVPIPSEVIDNSPHTVRVVSNGVREYEDGKPASWHLEYYNRSYRSLGYTRTELDAFDDGHRIVETRFFLPKLDKVVHHFRTEYYTRIDCARCSMRWATAYVLVEQDGQPVADPEPLCSYHLDLENQRVRGGCGAGMNLKLHQSAPLRIGQHHTEEEEEEEETVTNRMGSVQARVLAGDIKKAYDEVAHWQDAHPGSGDTMVASLRYFLSKALETATLMDQSRRRCEGSVET